MPGEFSVRSVSCHDIHGVAQPGFAYHVLNRVIGRARLFRSQKHYAAFERVCSRPDSVPELGFLLGACRCSLHEIGRGSLPNTPGVIVVTESLTSTCGDRSGGGGHRQPKAIAGQGASALGQGKRQRRSALRLCRLTAKARTTMSTLVTEGF